MKAAPHLVRGSSSKDPSVPAGTIENSDFAVSNFHLVFERNGDRFTYRDALLPNIKKLAAKAFGLGYFHLSV